SQMSRRNAAESCSSLPCGSASAPRAAGPWRWPCRIHAALVIDTYLPPELLAEEDLAAFHHHRGWRGIGVGRAGFFPHPLTPRTVVEPIFVDSVGSAANNARWLKRSTPRRARGLCRAS